MTTCDTWRIISIIAVSLGMTLSILPVLKVCKVLVQPSIICPRTSIGCIYDNGVGDIADYCGSRTDLQAFPETQINLLSMRVKGVAPLELSPFCIIFFSDPFLIFPNCIISLIDRLYTFRSYYLGMRLSSCSFRGSSERRLYVPYTVLLP